MTRLDLSEQDCVGLIESRAQELISLCSGGNHSRESVERLASEILALAAGLASEPSEMDQAA